MGRDVTRRLAFAVVFGIASLAHVHARATPRASSLSASHTTPHALEGSATQDEALQRWCGDGDAALHRMAVHVAEQQLAGKRQPTMIELGKWLRAWREPHPGARAWTIRGTHLDRREATRRARRWIDKHRGDIPHRCGVASVLDSERGEALTVVMVPVRAELRTRIPATTRQGRWITVDAQMIQWADDAKVVVLAPRGAPRTVPTSYDRRQGKIVGRFMADQPGTWLVQVLANLRAGPRPVLEAEVEVGEGRRGTAGRPVSAPGEAAGNGRPDADAIFAMLNAARTHEGLAPVARDRVLDRVAMQHVRQMIGAGVVAHDAGDGPPLARVADAGVSSSEVGENVSRASSVTLVHRALWESPSHRANMLHSRYVRVGIAAARDARGRVWVAQEFAGTRSR